MPRAAADAPAVGHPSLPCRLRCATVVRDEVATRQARAGRARALGVRALRPAAATDHWQQLAGSISPQNRRRAREHVGRRGREYGGRSSRDCGRFARGSRDPQTAALVTPDRALARVLAALDRWKITVDDSGGDALADTSAGLFARLAAEAALGGLRRAVVALLKHPLTRSAPAGTQAPAIATLEKALLRGPRPQSGTTGLTRALATFRADLAKLRRGEPSDLHPSEPRTRLTGAELDTAAALVERIASALAPLEAPAGFQSFASLAERHRDVVVALSTDEAGEAAAFAGNGGVKLHEAFDDIAGNAAGLIVSHSDYADLFKTRSPIAWYGSQRTRACACASMNLLEARLQRVDRVARLPRRRHVAAGDALRSLAQPSHALRPRPRSAGAAHLALGARFCAGARRRRGHPRLSCQARRRADRDLALRPAARRGRRRGAGSRMQQRRAISHAGARARPCRRAQAYR